MPCKRGQRYFQGKRWIAVGRNLTLRELWQYLWVGGKDMRKVLRKIQAKKEVEGLVVGIPTLWGWWGGGGFSGALVALWLQPASVPWIGHSWRHLLLLPQAWLDFGWRRFFRDIFLCFSFFVKIGGMLDAFIFDLLVLCQVGYSQKSFLDNCVWWGGVFK